VPGFLSDNLGREIEALGLRHRITSRRTSLVAIAEEPTVDPLAPRRRERLALEMPAGVSAEGLGLSGFYSISMLTMPGMAEEEVGQLRQVECLYDSEHQISRLRMTEPVTVKGTVLQFDSSELTLEFTVPVGGFAFPQDGKVTVLHPRSNVVKIVPEKSTPAGSYEAGMVIRLTLRRRPGGRWPSHGTVHLAFDDFNMTVELDPGKGTHGA
jgi:hypothetical protein